MADWNRFSEDYDRIFLENPMYVETMGLLADAVGGAGGARVLDLGCGTGNTIAEILQRHPGTEVHGVDPSEGMLEKSSRRFGSDSVELRQGDALGIPYPDGFFDGIVSHLALHHLDPGDRAGCARELARVLKPGGRLVYADMFSDVDAPPEDPVRAKDIINKMTGIALYCIDQGAYDMSMIILSTLPADVASDGEYLTTPAVWVEVLEQAGFTGFEVRDIPPGGFGLYVIIAGKPAG